MSRRSLLRLFVTLCLMVIATFSQTPFASALGDRNLLSISLRLNSRCQQIRVTARFRLLTTGENG